MSVRERVQVVYITSLGASGSTLLDLLISAHPQVFSVGEVVNLSDLAHLRRTDREFHKLGNECTCGAETIWQCPFWTEVDRVIRERSELSLRDMDLRPRYARHSARDNRLVFEAVAQVSGKTYIVDSSKDPKRLAALIDDDVVDVKAIHLFRDPRGMINSRLRRGRKLLRSVAMFYKVTWLVRRTTARTDSIVVHYSRLTENPEQEMRRIMRFIGLEFEPQQLQWAGRERHNIGGNRMRRTTDSTIRQDLGWKKELTPWNRLALEVLTWPARLFLRPR